MDKEYWGKNTRVFEESGVVRTLNNTLHDYLLFAFCTNSLFFCVKL